jgi:hypothetical protein
MAFFRPWWQLYFRPECESIARLQRFGGDALSQTLEIESGAVTKGAD